MRPLKNAKLMMGNNNNLFLYAVNMDTSYDRSLEFYEHNPLDWDATEDNKAMFPKIIWNGKIATFFYITKRPSLKNYKLVMFNNAYENSGTAYRGGLTITKFELQKMPE